MNPLIDPKEITVFDRKGNPFTCTIGAFPAIAGRRIASLYPTSMITASVKGIGDYDVNEKIMLEMMSYVEVTTKDGNKVRLTTAGLIDSHIPDTQAQMQIEWELGRHSFTFLADGTLLDLLAGWVQGVQAKIIETLTPSSGQ